MGNYNDKDAFRAYIAIIITFAITIVIPLLKEFVDGFSVDINFLSGVNGVALIVVGAYFGLKTQSTSDPGTFNIKPGVVRLILFILIVGGIAIGFIFDSSVDWTYLGGAGALIYAYAYK
jgi:hypothetical protein